MDDRFTLSSGIELFNGNELIVKGGLESGVSLITGYPGSPVAEVFDVAHSISDLLEQHGILAELANNEALSAARLNGAQMAGIRAMAVFKNVGYHVASDAVAISNFAGCHPEGGAVVVVGDDPWNSSTQVPADSRYISKHLFVPVVEPATFQELKDWLAVCFDLAAKSNLYICYLVTTNLADGGATAEMGSNNYPKISTRAKVQIDPAQVNTHKRVVLPPDTTPVEADVVLERFPRLLEEVRKTSLNSILYRGDASQKKPVGFVASGLTYTYLEHAFYELGMNGEFPVLKLGMTYPLDENIVREFAACVDTIVVVEEKRGFLEEQFRDILSRAAQGDGNTPTPVWGKTFPKGEGIPSLRGLNPSLIAEKLIALLSDFPGVDASAYQESWKALTAKYETVKGGQGPLPSRIPTFCPGCPHRDSGSVFEEILQNFAKPEYMKKNHGCGPVKLVFHGDIGCYAMFKYPPFEHLIHNLSGMGLGGGTGRGIDSFITNKQVVFVGDGTFFHSEIVAISDSIKNGQDITYIIMDNKTTAMTGHQSTPGIEENVMGGHTRTQDILSALEGLGDDLFLVRTDPAKRVEYQRLVERTVLMDGVKVIVADKECGITYNRKRKKIRTAEVKKKGFLEVEEHINVTEEVCENCMECTKKTACPGLAYVQTPYGQKVQIDKTNCVQDLACNRIKACPSFEKVIIKRTKKPRPRAYHIPERELPAPNARPMDEVWYSYSAGVGGMGIGVVSTILSRAGMKEGYAVRFNNKKGLAIRNGGVFAHVIYMKKDRPISPILPWGSANLVLGLDLIECGRALEPKAGFMVGSKTSAVVTNTAAMETISTLIDREHTDRDGIETFLRENTDGDRYFSADLFQICERIFDNRLYANLMLLGAAWQRGEIPVSLDSMLWAIQRTVRPHEMEANVRAFKLGRQLAQFPGDFKLGRPRQSAADLMEEKHGYLMHGHDDGPAVATEYRHICEYVAASVRLDDDWMRELNRRIYDCLQWEDFHYARRYADRIVGIFEKDSAEHDYKATKAAILYLAKVMCIKDEVYVSELLVSEEKLARDMERFNVDPANGDQIFYRHLNRPHFDFWKFHLEFDVTTYNWMLKIMRKFKWLRRILTQWHSRERKFRDWYEGMVANFSFASKDDYDRYVQALECPEEVRGYRDIRYPKMEAAYRKAAELLTPKATSAAPRREEVGVHGG